MTAFPALFRGRQRGRLGFSPAVAVLCLALLATLAFAQVAHLHSSAADSDHCQLCAVMHTVAPVAAFTAAIVLVQLGAFTPQGEPILLARQRVLRLSIRPPPESC